MRRQSLVDCGLEWSNNAVAHSVSDLTVGEHAAPVCSNSTGRAFHPKRRKGLGGSKNGHLGAPAEESPRRGNLQGLKKLQRVFGVVAADAQSERVPFRTACVRALILCAQ
jgi:hypothetical protein